MYCNSEMAYHFLDFALFRGKSGAIYIDGIKKEFEDVVHNIKTCACSIL